MAASVSSGASVNPATTIASISAAAIDTHSKDSKWIMTREQMQNSPSRRDGISADQELNLRQKASHLIQEMGQRLRVSQLCINTAIVYMHRFYMCHSFQIFHRTGVAAACLFLGAKVEEQPRKVESIIQMLFASQNLKFPEVGSTTYQEQSQDLVFNENVLLQTLGFDVAVVHPHTYILKACELVQACKDLVNTSYFLASNSLHLTTMCLQYPPTVVACFCIYLACKWSRWEIPISAEGIEWFHYVVPTITMDILEQLTNEYLVIYEKSPSRLKKQLNNCQSLGLNAKSPAQPGSSQMSRPHHSSQSQSSSASSHQRSTVHHHAGKLPPPQQQHGIGGANDHHKMHAQSASAQMLAKQSSTSQPPSSLSGSSTSSRHPQQMHRSDHRAPPTSHVDPHFSAPHRTSSSSSSSNGMPTAQQMQAYGLPANSGSGSSSSSSGKSRHPQQQSQQLQQQQQPYLQMNAHQQLGQQQQQPQHHSKQRSSKEPPPKFVDPKMPAPQGAVVTGSAGVSKKHSYPQQMQQQQQPQPPPHMSKQSSASSIPHLASKSSNYPMQPPNYNQSIAGRNDGGHQHGGGNHYNQQSQSSSVHQQPQHPQQQQQHHHNHQHVPPNAYGSTSDTAGGYNRLGNNTTTAPASATGDDLMSMMMSDTGADSAKSSKMPSIFSPDYANVSAAGPQTPKKDKLKRDPTATASMDYKSNTYGGTAVDGGRHRSSGMQSSSSSASTKHRGDDFSAGQMVSVPPPGAFGMAKPPQHQQQQQQRTIKQEVKQELDEHNPDFGNKQSKRSYGDEYASNSVGTDLHRDAKYRKVDADLQGNMSSTIYGGTTTTASVSSMLKSGSTFNGVSIETNPDLVSSLLKESLCSNDAKYSNNLLTSSLVASSNDYDTSMMSLDNMLDSKPPLNLLATDMMPATTMHSNHLTVQSQQPQQQQSSYQQPPPLTQQPVKNTNTATVVSANDSSDHEHRHKSEKKKKKEKSKHKDKSKDRDERKKHKKDKERNRERESDHHHHHHRSSTSSNGPSLAGVDPAAADGAAHNPIKIKIPRDKLTMADGAAGNAPSGLKITIPKDRLTGAADGANSAAASSLKIKISKDVLESYGTAGHHGGSGTGSSSGGGGSGKKRDRDRDRDRSAGAGAGDGSKGSAAQHHQQHHHGSGGGGGGGGGGGSAAANASKDVWVNQ